MIQKIKLMTPQDVEEFVGITSTFDYDIDLRRGTRYIDAKSILGVMAVALKSEADLICQQNDVKLRTLISKFAVAQNKISSH